MVVDVVGAAVVVGSGVLVDVVGAVDVGDVWVAVVVVIGA